MGKVAEIEKFTETYSTIVTGLYSDMEQYAREVQEIRKEHSADKENFRAVYKELQENEKVLLRLGDKMDQQSKDFQARHQQIQETCDEIFAIANFLKELQSHIRTHEKRLGNGELNMVALRKELSSSKGMLLELQGAQENFQREFLLKEQNLKNRDAGLFALLIFILLLNILTIIF